MQALALLSTLVATHSNHLLQSSSDLQICFTLGLLSFLYLLSASAGMMYWFHNGELSSLNSTLEIAV
jgi:hypothetical protein